MSTAETPAADSGSFKGVPLKELFPEERPGWKGYLSYSTLCSHVLLNNRMRALAEPGHFLGMNIQQVSEMQHKIDTSPTIALRCFGWGFYPSALTNERTNVMKLQSDDQKHWQS